MRTPPRIARDGTADEASAPLPLLVVGAGPAGMAAAVAARRFGVETTVCDENAAPGGQVWRNIERVAAERSQTLALLGDDYHRGLAAVRRFHASGARFLPRTAVWQADARAPGEGVEVGLVADGAARLLRARRVLFATGAMERPVPIPGGTLPGVMSAGGAQTLLKNASLVPDGSVVLAGSGPLLLLLAWQLARAGAPPAALWLTVPRERMLDSLAELPRALLAPAQLGKGLRWLFELRRMGVPVEWGVRGLRAAGQGRLQNVSATIDSGERHVRGDLLLVHEGVVPSTHLAMSAGCRFDYEPAQHCWHPRQDGRGNSSVAGLMVAGDGAGIGGAEAAQISGRMAGVEAAYALGAIGRTLREHLLAADRSAHTRALRTRPWLDRLFEPTREMLAPVDNAVTVCRCEQVTADDLRRLAAMGVAGPNQAKTFSRCGMGPCQGRMCSGPVSELLARHSGTTPAQTGHLRQRPPVKPLTVAEMATLAGAAAPPGRGV